MADTTKGRDPNAPQPNEKIGYFQILMRQGLDMKTAAKAAGITLGEAAQAMNQKGHSAKGAQVGATAKTVESVKPQPTPNTTAGTRPTKKPQTAPGQGDLFKKPSRSTWTPERDQMLMTLLGQGKKVAQVAAILFTSVDAINSRARRLRNAGWDGKDPNVGAETAKAKAQAAINKVQPKMGGFRARMGNAYKHGKDAFEDSFRSGLEKHLGIFGKIAHRTILGDKVPLRKKLGAAGGQTAPITAEAIGKHSQVITSALSKLNTTHARGINEAVKALAGVTTKINSNLRASARQGTESKATGLGAGSMGMLGKLSGKGLAAGGVLGAIAAALGIGGAMLMGRTPDAKAAAVEKKEPDKKDDAVPKTEDTPKFEAEKEITAKDIDFKAKEIVFESDDIKFPSGMGGGGGVSQPGSGPVPTNDPGAHAPDAEPGPPPDKQSGGNDSSTPPAPGGQPPAGDPGSPATPGSPGSPESPATPPAGSGTDDSGDNNGRAEPNAPQPQQTPMGSSPNTGEPPPAPSTPVNQTPAEPPAAEPPAPQQTPAGAPASGPTFPVHMSGIQAGMSRMTGAFGKLPKALQAKISGAGGDGVDITRKDWDSIDPKTQKDVTKTLSDAGLMKGATPLMSDFGGRGLGDESPIPDKYTNAGYRNAYTNWPASKNIEDRRTEGPTGQNVSLGDMKNDDAANEKWMNQDLPETGKGAAAAGGFNDIMTGPAFTSRDNYRGNGPLGSKPWDNSQPWMDPNDIEKEDGSSNSERAGWGPGSYDASVRPSPQPDTGNQLDSESSQAAQPPPPPPTPPAMVAPPTPPSAGAAAPPGDMPNTSKQDHFDSGFQGLGQETSSAYWGINS